MNATASEHKQFDPSDFENLATTIRKFGIEGGLDLLERTFRQQKLYPQLFEVLKIKCRRRLGLPLLADGQSEPLDDATQRHLEDGLIEACHEVGIALVQAGQLEKGWTYLQPVGNLPSIKRAICQFPVDDHSRESLIEICLGQGLAPVYGYQLILENFGVCDAITTFDMQAPRFDRKIQQQMAELLLRRFYGDLCQNLVAIIQRERFPMSEIAIDTVPEEKSLAQLFADYPALRSDSVHAIDATHLVSVIRIARSVTDSQDLQKGMELCQYGDQLHADFHYPCPPPFESTFADHTIFFKALLGKETEQAIAHFDNKCQTVDPRQHGAVAYETLIDLLVRMGQREKAIELFFNHIWGKYEPLGIAPSIFQIAQSAAETAVLERHFAEQNDLLSYGISVMQINFTLKNTS